jgi:spermidine/putrescine transport system substrate-binding protein
MKCNHFKSVIALAAATILISGCAPKNERVLYIYNWTYYIPDDVIKDFKKQTGISVVYDLYASNEEMFAKLKAGGTGYDVVFPSGDYVSIMIREKMVAPIDKSKIPNFTRLRPDVLAKINYDPGCSYSVPFMMGAAGISVNTRQVPNFEKSWKIFDRSDLGGRMTLLDDMREALGAALMSLGYSVNSADTAELQKAKIVVEGWKKNIVKFDAEAFAKGFAAGEFWVVQGYAENVFLELDTAMRKDVAFFIPAEGSPAYIDNMVILNNAKHKELAYAFINYIHEPKVYARIVDFLMLPSINLAADTFRTIKPNYTIDDLKNSQIKEDLGPALELYNSIWQKIIVGN